MHTHTRKPEAIKAWRITEGEAIPAWATQRGMTEEKLRDRKTVKGKLVPGDLPQGWLVLNERREMIFVLSDDQFHAEYDTIE